MITVSEAQKKLIRNGYDIDLQSPYRELTILNAKHPEVKEFLQNEGYEGNFITIRKKGNDNKYL